MVPNASSPRFARARARRARCREASGACCRRNRRRSPGRSCCWMSRSWPCALQLVAEGGGAAILPDDGVVDRLAGLAVPDDGRLALIGDADGGDVAAVERRLSPGLRGRPRAGYCQISSGSCSTQPACGEDLAEFLLRDGADAPVVVENDGARTGGALVESENETHKCHEAAVDRGITCSFRSDIRCGCQAGQLRAADASAFDFLWSGK